MEGLAASMVQQPQQPPQAMGQMPSVDEVAAMLMEGVPPEELEKMGIPPELIMQAIELLEQQMGAQSQQQQPAPQMGGGLAQSVVG